MSLDQRKAHAIARDLADRLCAIQPDVHLARGSPFLAGFRQDLKNFICRWVPGVHPRRVSSIIILAVLRERGGRRLAAIKAAQDHDEEVDGETV